MRSTNRVTLTGFAGRDAETKYSQSGTKTVKVSIATTRSWKKRDADEWEEETTWHSIVAWGRTADALEAVRKGDAVHVDGRIDIQKWTDNDGNDRTYFQIVAENAHIAIKPPKQGEGGNTSYQGATQNPAAVNATTRKAPADAKPLPGGEKTDGVPFDDDVPF